MRYLIVSDIHSNWEALQAVLNHVRRKRFDQILFLGDAVGYGASPNRVMNWLRSVHPSAITVRGNHDRVCAGLESGEYFNRYALQAATWTLEHLETKNLEYLKNLPKGPVEVSPKIAICHGSSVDEDAYIFSAYDAQMAFEAIDHPVVFFGHTHVPSLFALKVVNGMRTLNVQLLTGSRFVLDLEDDTRYLINPGSVGQPRDRNRKAAYILYDDEQHRLYAYRVNYRAEAARRRIVQVGLPPVLGDRLLYGA